MKYRENYILSHDIDWFCKKGNIWIHACSRGGLLPAFVDNQDYLRRLQSVVSSLPAIVEAKDISINEKFIEARYNRTLNIYREFLKGNDFLDGTEEYIQSLNFDNFRSTFVESFREMALRGFYSFVRVNLDNPFDNNYKLVAYPRSNASEMIQESLNRHHNKDGLDEYLKAINSPMGNFEISFEKDYDLLDNEDLKEH